MFDLIVKIDSEDTQNKNKANGCAGNVEQNVFSSEYSTNAEKSISDWLCCEKDNVVLTVKTSMPEVVSARRQPMASFGQDSASGVTGAELEDFSEN